ncbi:hypothetical protein Droror1_Dr00026654 [Drosera rotundifolia]
MEAPRRPTAKTSAARPIVKKLPGLKAYWAQLPDPSQQPSSAAAHEDEATLPGKPNTNGSSPACPRTSSMPGVPQAAARPRFDARRGNPLSQRTEKMKVMRAGDSFRWRGTTKGSAASAEVVGAEEFKGGDGW